CLLLHHRVPPFSIFETLTPPVKGRTETVTKRDLLSRITMRAIPAVPSGWNTIGADQLTPVNSSAFANPVSHSAATGTPPVATAPAESKAARAEGRVPATLGTFTGPAD